MRETRLVFYRDDIDRINRVLEEYNKLAKAKSNILIDKEGHAVTEVGQQGAFSSGSFDTDTLGALVAGAFAATKLIARLIGEEEFKHLSHQGKKDHVQLTLIADRCILTTIFDDSTTAGMIRMEGVKAAKKLETIFRELAERKEAPPGEEIQEGFNEAAQSALDDVFGG